MSDYRKGILKLINREKIDPGRYTQHVIPAVHSIGLFSIPPFFHRKYALQSTLFWIFGIEIFSPEYITSINQSIGSVIGKPGDPA